MGSEMCIRDSIIPGLQYKALTTGGRMIPRNVVRALTRVVGKGRDRT